MNDNVKPLRPDIPVRSSSIDTVLKELDELKTQIESGEINPQWGCFVYQTRTGSVCTYLVGETVNLTLVGALTYAAHLHMRDAEVTKEY